MTCEEIFSLHAPDTENSDLYDAYRNVPLDSRMKCIRTILLCTQPAILQTLQL